MQREKAQEQEDKLSRALAAVQARVPFCPRIAVVLGSGLGDFAESLDIKKSIDYSSIPDFPVTTVEGHHGRLIFACLGDIPLLLMQGRCHYYEGHSMDVTVLPIRLARLLGVEILVLTNASGAINPNFQPGEFMLVTNHISFLVPSPLLGKNLDQLGPRFPDMSEVYDLGLRKCILAAAREESIALQQGVYIQTSGPNFETPAEIRFCRSLGADAVGMSTVSEAMAAHHCGLRVCALSCIANLAAGLSPQPLSLAEVYATSARVAPIFQRLLHRVLLQLERKELSKSD